MTTTNQNQIRIHTTFYVWDSLTEALKTFDKALVQRGRESFSLEDNTDKLDTGLRDAYQTLVRKCHNDELPNDWRYDKIKHLVERLLEYEKESLEDYQDILHEVVDSCVDIISFSHNFF